MGDDTSGPSTGFHAWIERIIELVRREPRDRHEVIDILRAAEGDSLLDPETVAMMEGALQVSQMQVRDIMVPRSEMVVVEEGLEPEEFLPTIIESGHSRFPLIDAKRDQVVGILLAKDFLAYHAGDDTHRFDLDDVIRPAVFVPESKRLNILLREFRTSRNHMAIVVDEYGGTAGLISIEDVLEQIVGEIDDEHDIEEEGYIRPHGRNRYTLKARTPIADFNGFFDTDFDDKEFDTVGGLLLKEFGRVPKGGEQIDVGGFNFTVLRADQRRLHTLRVIKSARLPQIASG